VGVDDGAFYGRKEQARKTTLLVVLLEGPQILELRLGAIEVDGTDASTVLRSLLSSLSYDVVMLSGISFGGFNLVDMNRLARSTGKPVIAVIREKPNNKAVHAALRKHFPDWRERWRIVQDAGPLYSCKPLAHEPKLYFEVKGASPALARRFIVASSQISRLPEPVRVAGILAKGLGAFSG
jgi:endonuclease V-like protein UPF0215 family